MVSVGLSNERNGMSCVSAYVDIQCRCRESCCPRVSKFRYTIHNRSGPPPSVAPSHAGNIGRVHSHRSQVVEVVQTSTSNDTDED